MAQPPQVPFHVDASLLGRVLQKFPSGYINVFDRELRFLLAEGRGLAALGLSPEHFAGKSLHDLFPNEVADYVAAYLERAFAGADVDFELSYQGRYYTISASPPADENGEVNTIVAAATDITDYRQLEHIRDQFLSLVAHDLKGPLTAIRSLAQSCQRRAHDVGMDDDQLRDSYMHIEMAADTMINQINHLVQDAELSTGEVFTAGVRPIDLIEIVGIQVGRYGRISPTHQISMQTEATRLVGNWDRRRLEMMLANLLSNAIKFSPDGGAISVRLTREDRFDSGWAVFMVSDPGIGIPEAELDRVFERLYRASNVVGRIDGTGNGLAGVRDFVSQHGGTISVQSREGGGSTFTVRLPLASGETNQ